MRPAEVSLHDAARGEDAAIISGLLQKDKASVDALDGYSRTPLMWASYAGQVDSTRLLLTHGASIDMTDWCGDTALHEACFKGHKDVAGMLLARGADPGIRDQWGWTALMAAAGTGRVEIVRELLRDRRVNVNQVDYSGRTALWRASCNGHADVVEALLVEGHANPCLPDDEGVTALGIARARGRKDCAALIQRFEESEPIFLLAKARRLTDETQMIERAGMRRKYSAWSEDARQARIQVAPRYLRARVARGEMLPLVDVKVGSRKRSRRELELRATVAYIVHDMDRSVYESLMDFFRQRLPVRARSPVVA